MGAWKRGAVAAAAAGATVLGGMAIAQAADPTGTLTLATGLGGHPAALSPAGLTSQGVAWSDGRAGASTYSVVPTSGGSVGAAFTSPAPNLASCTGGNVLVSPDAGDGSTVYWHDLASGGNGSFVPATGATVLGPTVNGWMYAAGTGTGGAAPLHRVTTSGADPLVGTLANPVDATPISALSYACDATGFAVSGYADNGTKEVEEVVYGAFSGGALTVVSTQTIASANQAYRVVGVAGTTVLYTEETSSGAAVESLYRVAVGGTPTQLRAGAEESVLAATATSTSTAYAVSPPGETAQLYLQPTGGSAGLVTTMPATGEVSVWPNGSATVVAVAGIGRCTLSGTSLTKTWTPAPGPLAASGVQASPQAAPPGSTTARRRASSTAGPGRSAARRPSRAAPRAASPTT